MTHTPAPTRYDNPALYRHCGRSGLKLPVISLGLWHNFGAHDDYANSRALLLRAFDLGITHFDLANNYGPPAGEAEANFGRILREDLAAYRDELVVSTKAGYWMWDGPYGEWGSRKYLLSSLERSLQRLGLDAVDIFYSHRPDPDTPMEETIGALDAAVRSGKALYAGISNYSAEQTRRAAEIARDLGTPLLIHQPRYNVRDRWVEGGLLDVLAEEGMGCIAYSPLAQGVLTDRYLRGVPADSRAAQGHFLTASALDDTTMTHVRALTEIASGRGQALAEMALQWVLRHEGMTSVLIGASSVAQLETNVRALSGPPLADDELAAIDRTCREAGVAVPG